MVVEGVVEHGGGWFVVSVQWSHLNVVVLYSIFEASLSLSLPVERDPLGGGFVVRRSVAAL